MDKKYVHRLVMCKNANCYRRELNWEVDSLESAQHQTKKYHVKNNYYTRDLNSCICMLGIVPKNHSHKLAQSQFRKDSN